ncbi:hypothetical protein [Parvularcula sp. LCG005]|uniref:hypothetical protein n=1 Tax=Parvularcula sp. LCG005 TaxID=3078805 RepID=UPI002941CC05|nr:hypothetical protein [Parvularcula sp. LCG005]WOI52719.1 hypothetical protein RUI03_11235 [Parvularcula sp. LCG005]
MKKILTVLAASWGMLSPAISAQPLPCTGVLACQDFEGADVDLAVAFSGEAELTVDRTKAHGGAASLRIASAGGKPTGFLLFSGAPLFAELRESVFGRFWLWLDATPETPVHWTMIEASGQHADGHQVMLRYGGQHPVVVDGAFVGSRMMANYETPEFYWKEGAMGSDCWQHGADDDVLPTGRWACVAFGFDGAANRWTIDVDGRNRPALTVDGRGQGCLHQPADFPWDMPNIDTLKLGWEAYQEDEPRTLWIDDILIDDKPVQCPSSAGAR